MSSRYPVRPPEAESFFQLLASCLAPYLVVEQHPNDVPGPVYYHQGDSPLGRRQHLDLVRRGVLPAHKTGRKVLVRRDDVYAYLAARKSDQRVTTAKADDPLSEWGLTQGRRR